MTAQVLVSYAAKNTPGRKKKKEQQLILIESIYNR